MSEPRSHSPDFMRTAMDLGFGLLGVALVESEPNRLARAFEERLSFAAKYLSKATGMKRSQSYEALAKSGGFSDWHHLSEHLKHAGPGSGNLGEAWTSALAPLLPLLTEVDKDVPISEGAKAIYEGFWARVAARTGSDAATVLDAVAAPMLGEKSWSAFSRRDPADARGDLYRFMVFEGGREGGFRSSKACSALVDRLDAVYQGYEFLPAREKTKARKSVRDIAAKRPDFLEGQLAWADILREERSPDAEAVLDGALARAEALIPAGFDGRIVWGRVDDRFYHRLLWLRFTMLRDARRGSEAEAVARKMLRLNPNDNLGVRYELPLLLLTSGKHAEADAACEDLRHPDTSISNRTAAILAFVAFANGREEEFRRQLLRSLFTWPPLRVCLQPSAATMHRYADDTRGMTIDLAAFADAATPAYRAVPGLRDACLSLVERRDVAAAEAELGCMWKGFWQVWDPREQTSSLEEWEERLEHHVVELAK